jgi:zinc transport system permease protein
VSGFWAALIAHPFLQCALAAGLLASVACGVVGTYVAARRITYIAGGIAHCILGGMGAARYLQVVHGVTWFTPLYGAVASGLLAAAIIGLTSMRAREREDTTISALWAIGMSFGVLCIAKTPGYSENLLAYLFGNILMVSPADLKLIAGLDAVVVVCGVLFYEPLLAVCFDEEFARLRGLRSDVYYMLLLCLTALTVVLLVTVVGLVMVIALLSLPVAIAGRFSRTLWHSMVLGALFSAVFSTMGLVVSYRADLPAGAVTILLVGAAYVLTLVVPSRRRARPASAEATD